MVLNPARVEEASPAMDESAKTIEATPLAELLSDGAGQSGEWELKVIRSVITEYQYTYQGSQVTTHKLQTILLSHDSEQYCMGIARILKKDQAELAKQHKKFEVGSNWKFTKVHLMTTEKA